VIEASPVAAPVRARRSVLRTFLANPWVGFLIRRAIGLVCVLIALIVAVFFMVRLVPGDPVTNALGLDTPLDQLDRIRHEFGIDKPLFQQFTTYITRLIHGDLGKAFGTHQPVSQLIQQRIGSSLQLAGAALAIVLIAGVTIGMLAAAMTREGRRPKAELGFAGTTSVLGAIPDYLTGTILAFIFAVQFRLLPVAGSGSFEQLILPALAIAIPSTATLSRIVRVETLNVLAQDYIRTARSERIPPWRVYLRHALPNVLTAALTIGGLIFANLIGGAVVVENVFARAGLGSALVSAVIAKEYPIVQGIVLVLGVTVVVVNTIVDILLGVLDPRTLTKQQ
jgi:peptide/nickel transport system permease protein